MGIPRAKPGWPKPSGIRIGIARTARAQLVFSRICYWLDDPDNPRKAPDGVGGLNSTLVVQEGNSVRDV